MKNQKIDIKKKVIEGMNEEQAELLNSVNDDWIKKFIEQGAEIEHNRWSRWQSYLFSKSEWTKDGYLIPRELCFRWQKQIDTPYSELSEKEKESDKKEVENYLPILYELLEKIKYKDKIEETINSIMEILKEQIK